MNGIQVEPNSLKFDYKVRFGSSLDIDYPTTDVHVVTLNLDVGFGPLVSKLLCFRPTDVSFAVFGPMYVPSTYNLNLLILAHIMGAF